jgi:hypothetical protein
MSRPSDRTLLFFIGNAIMTFDVTLTDNFQYQSQFVDTENITRRGKLPKLPINKDKIKQDMIII